MIRCLVYQGCSFFFKWYIKRDLFPPSLLIKPRSLFINLPSGVQLVFYLSIIYWCFLAALLFPQCLFCFHLVRLKSLSFRKKRKKEKVWLRAEKGAWLLFISPPVKRPFTVNASGVTSHLGPGLTSVHVTETRKRRRVLTWEMKWYLTRSCWTGASVAELVWIRSRGKIPAVGSEL